MKGLGLGLQTAPVISVPCCLRLSEGSAIPEGTTAYVLTEESDGYYIWNSATGKRYNVNDNYCPLQSVGCLVNNENVSCFFV